MAGRRIHCEWGPMGMREASRLGSDCVILIDVLSFTTCVGLAVARGASLIPWDSRVDDGAGHARALGAELAGKRGSGARYSLSPESMMTIERGARLVLPSPNGGALSLMSEARLTLAASLRNVSTVAQYANQYADAIMVVPAGERWPDGTLRPAIEDWLCAGAVIAQLNGERSSEATAAASMWEACADRAGSMIAGSLSGQELIERGYGRDVELTTEVDADEVVGVSQEGEWRTAQPRQDGATVAVAG